MFHWTFPVGMNVCAFFVCPLSDDFAFLFSVHSLRVCVCVLCVIFMFIFCSYLLVYVDVFVACTLNEKRNYQNVAYITNQFSMWCWSQTTLHSNDVMMNIWALLNDWSRDVRKISFTFGFLARSLSLSCFMRVSLFSSLDVYFEKDLMNVINDDCMTVMLIVIIFPFLRRDACYLVTIKLKTRIVFHDQLLLIR